MYYGTYQLPSGQWQEVATSESRRDLYENLFFHAAGRSILISTNVEDINRVVNELPTQTDLLRLWLLHPKRRGILSVRELEKRLEMPLSTLTHFLNGQRELPKKFLLPLVHYLADYFGYVIEQPAIMLPPADKIH